MFCNTKKKYCRNRCRQKAYNNRKKDIKEIQTTPIQNPQPKEKTSNQIIGELIGHGIKKLFDL